MKQNVFSIKNDGGEGDMKGKSEKELLCQQLELLAEKSKDTYPASDELSRNSSAMVAISAELFKRKWLPIVILITLGYLLQSFAIHRK